MVQIEKPGTETQSIYIFIHGRTRIIIRIIIIIRLVRFIFNRTPHTPVYKHRPRAGALFPRTSERAEQSDRPTDRRPTDPNNPTDRPTRTIRPTRPTGAVGKVQRFRAERFITVARRAVNPGIPAVSSFLRPDPLSPFIFFVSFCFFFLLLYLFRVKL